MKSAKIIVTLALIAAALLSLSCCDRKAEDLLRLKCKVHQDTVANE